MCLILYFVLPVVDKIDKAPSSYGQLAKKTINQ